MGMRGPNAVAPRKEPAPVIITPEALVIYRRMRRLEREQGGPDGDGWWAMNRSLARALDLFEGLAVYEDPAWQDPRSPQFGLDLFHQLERSIEIG
jgi:hypothetical protein